MKKKKPNYKNYLFGSMVGNSKAMHQVFEFIKEISNSNDNVLILGETGTGKELVAREVHQRSGRKKKPFISVNCSAIPETLLESELFGYEKGAFTGADRLKEGKFELAKTGTLYLDEIGDMPLTCQAKILRIIEEKQVQRLGGKTNVMVDTRIIASTSLDLFSMMQEGKFRKDLYYRLDEASIELPRLAQHIEDIPLLVNFFIAQFKEDHSKTKTLSDAVLAILLSHDWPGNIRELRNIIKKSLHKAEHEQIWVEDLPIVLKDHYTKRLEIDVDGILSLKEYEKRYIKKVLDLTEWDKVRAADLLNIGRKTIYNKIKEYNLKP
jgi:transcriptional regulator with PAS, ATPase and Fis domain